MTSRTKPETRWATADDLRRFYAGRQIPVTLRARVAEFNGEIVGMIGWYRRGEQAFVVSEVRGEMRRFPRLILQEARAMLDSLKLPGLCMADPKEPGARRLLEWLGWRYLMTTDEGEAYIWQHCH